VIWCKVPYIFCTAFFNILQLTELNFWYKIHLEKQKKEIIKWVKNLILTLCQ
jgi:hypothetical protein